jgi:predicted kinase
MNKKFVLKISGQSCTGKSTLEQELQHGLPQFYLVCYDKLKWQLSNYHRLKDKDFIKELTLSLFEVICKKKLPIILLGAIRTKVEYDRYYQLAIKYGYKFYNVKLTAPREVLIKRFDKRIASAKKAKSKISVTSKKLFIKNLENIYYCPANAPEFDTSKMSVKQIANEVVKLIK